RLEHGRMLAVIAPGDLEAAGEAHEVLDGVEMAVQTGAVAGFAFGDADDEPARTLDRSAGAAALVIGRRHHRIDLSRRDLLHRAGRNAVGGEILLLIGLQLVEAGYALLHGLGTERFRCHGAAPPSASIVCDIILRMRRLVEAGAGSIHCD